MKQNCLSIAHLCLSICGCSVVALGCYCDSSCEVYNDCCVNYISIDPRRSLEHDHTFECVNVRLRLANSAPEAADQYIQIVNSCPSSRHSSEAHVAKNCISYDGLLPPATDPSTNVTYKNMFCAICHGISNVSLWSLELKGSNKTENMTMVNITKVMECVRLEHWNREQELLDKQFLFCSHNFPRSHRHLHSITAHSFHNCWHIDFFLEREEELSGKGTPYFRIFFVLFFASNIMWVFGFVGLLIGMEWAWYPFNVLLSSQGFIIFLGFFGTKKISKLYVSPFAKVFDRCYAYFSTKVTTVWTMCYPSLFISTFTKPFLILLLCLSD